MTDKVSRLPEPKSFAPKAGELHERITNLIHEYDGEIGVAEAQGVLMQVILNLHMEALSET